MTETLPAQPLDATAGELARALARRQIGAVELAEAAIARIEARDGALNAVVVRDFERALQAAGDADASLTRGDRRPLLGVPMTVKESHNIAGLPTTWGFEASRSWTAAEDSVGVRRLKAAGAVILGKTNVPVGLSDWQSANPIYGRTSNPWDLGRSPGGSSGGSAAALAARMAPLEFGSDIGGSIRVPAAFCGVYGHKPSYGLIPTRGHVPPGSDGAAPPMAVVGPLARSAADLELALGVLAGPDEDEARGYRLGLPGPRHGRLADYRVLVVDHHPLAAVDGEIRAAIGGVADRLGALGAAVARKTGLLPDLARAQEVYAGILLTVMGARQGSAPMPALEFLGLIDAQARVRRQWAALFESFDVVLAPVFGAAAFPHDDERDQSKRTLLIDGRPEPFFIQSAWPGLANLANLPATAAPIGRTKAGLPIGMQIVGPYLEDLTTIGFADLLAREIGGYAPPPGY